MIQRISVKITCQTMLNLPRAAGNGWCIENGKHQPELYDISTSSPENWFVENVTVHANVMVTIWTVKITIS